MSINDPETESQASASPPPESPAESSPEPPVLPPESPESFPGSAEHVSENTSGESSDEAPDAPQHEQPDDVETTLGPLGAETIIAPSSPAPSLDNSPDLRDPATVISFFEWAAKANMETPGRTGCVVDLPDHGQLLMSGDLHDNTPNLRKLLLLADLAAADHHLVLHEVIHSGRRVSGMDLSIRILAQVARLKLQYPDRIHVMAGNHEWAQLMGSGILKGGTDVVEAFSRGVEYLYGEQAEAVTEAMNRFIRTMLLAVRCANGILCTHSLPSPRRIDGFDDTILERMPTRVDFKRDGPVYELVWGRNHDEFVAEEIGEAWEADMFIMGHQPAGIGYDIEGYNMLILASDHDHAMALPIDLSRKYDIDTLIHALVPLASVDEETV